MNADWCTSNGSDHWAGQQVLASFLLFCQLDNYVMPPLDAVLIELLGGSGRKDAARHVAVVLWTTFRGPIGDVVSGPLWSHSRRFGLFWFDCLKNHVSEKLWPLATKRVGRERRHKKVKTKQSFDWHLGEQMIFINFEEGCTLRISSPILNC